MNKDSVSPLPPAGGDDVDENASLGWMKSIHPTYQLTLHLFKRTVFIQNGIIILGNVTLGYAVKLNEPMW